MLGVSPLWTPHMELFLDMVDTWLTVEKTILQELMWFAYLDEQMHTTILFPVQKPRLPDCFNMPSSNSREAD